MTRIALALGRAPGSPATLSTARKAVELYEAGTVDCILMSGQWSVASTGTWDTTECASMLRLARDLGVPSDRVMGDDQSRDTFSNMTESQRVLTDHGIRSGQIIVVTIPHADKRAGFAARRCFLSDFEISTQVSDYDFSRLPGREAHVISQERLMLLASRLSLIGVRRGDHAAIQRRLRLWHPGYRQPPTQQPIRLI